MKFQIWILYSFEEWRKFLGMSKNLKRMKRKCQRIFLLTNFNRRPKNPAKTVFGAFSRFSRKNIFESFLEKKLLGLMISINCKEFDTKILEMILVAPNFLVEIWWRRWLILVRIKYLDLEPSRIVLTILLPVFEKRLGPSTLLKNISFSKTGRNTEDGVGFGHPKIVDADGDVDPICAIWCKDQSWIVCRYRYTTLETCKRGLGFLFEQPSKKIHLLGTLKMEAISGFG